jgi:hypothetical protein
MTRRANEKWMVWPVLLVAAVLAVGLVASRGASVRAAPAVQGGCSGNLLTNPNFDGGSHKTESLGTSLSSAVGDGWVPWFIRGDATWNREPEFKVEQVAIGGDSKRTRSGGQSMKWFTTWGTHTAGVYQRVNVPSGATLTFTMYGLIYSGEDDGWDAAAGTFRSDPIKPGNYRIWAGIDPTGAVPNMGSAPGDTVVWTAPSMTTDTWVPLTVVAKARGNAVTVFAKGAPEWPVKHNDSWWEDACLVVGGQAPVEAEAAAAPVAGSPASGAQPTAAGTDKVIMPAALPATGHAAPARLVRSSRLREAVRFE